MAYLIVGLGNPGSQYKNTWHNLGFMVVDRLLSKWGASTPTAKFQSDFIVVKSVPGICEDAVYLQKPNTFMNLSGNAVREASQFYKIEPCNILVLFDDLDTPPEILRIRKKGGAGGHNGMRSIIECLGTQEFPRIRLGIGKDNKNILAPIPKKERDHYDVMVHRCADAIESILKDGIDRAMNTFNQTEKEST